MKKFLSNPVVLSLLVLVALTAVLSQPWVNAGALTAAASAIAAIGAFLAAQRSSLAARESVRALSYATKPIVWVETWLHGGVGIILHNQASFRAALVTVTYQSRAGKVVRRGVPFLEGEGGFAPRQQPRLIQLEDTLPTGAGVDQVFIEYGAERGETRWRLTLDFDDDLSDYRVTDEREL